LTTGSILRLYIALKRDGVPLKAIDPGERVTLPQQRACACGRRKPHFAPKKRRWLCAACGKPWPTKIVVSGAGKQRRAKPPNERQLDFLAEVGCALERLSHARRELVLLWHDHGVVPHERGRWRQAEVAEHMRALRPRAVVVLQPSRVKEDFSAAMDVLEGELSRRGMLEGRAA
jgi:hypothetical protein